MMTTTQPPSKEGYAGRYPSTQYPNASFSTAELSGMAKQARLPYQMNGSEGKILNQSKQANAPQTLQQPNQHSTPGVPPSSDVTMVQPQITTYQQTRAQNAGMSTTAAVSPFSSAISAGPRERPNQILLINSTSTALLSARLLSGVQEVLPHALELKVYTAPYPSPTAIETTTDAILSSETVIRDLAKHSTNNGETVMNFDAMIVCAFTPAGARSSSLLTEGLRESYDVPIVSTLEASIYVARMLGTRFGIIAVSTRSKMGIEDAVRDLGLHGYLAAVESLHMSSLDLLSSSSTTTSSSAASETSHLPGPPSNRASVGVHPSPSVTTTSRSRSQATNSVSVTDINKRLVVASRSLVSKGADTIILGSEFLCHNEFARMVKDAVREEDGRRLVNVIDPIEAAVQMATGLVGMALPTSKKGAYRNEREGRRARGQMWL